MSGWWTYFSRFLHYFWVSLPSTYAIEHRKGRTQVDLANVSWRGQGENRPRVHRFLACVGGGDRALGLSGYRSSSRLLYLTSYVRDARRPVPGSSGSSQVKIGENPMTAGVLDHPAGQ